MPMGEGGRGCLLLVLVGGLTLVQVVGGVFKQEVLYSTMQWSRGGFISDPEMGQTPHPPVKKITDYNKSIKLKMEDKLHMFTYYIICLLNIFRNKPSHIKINTEFVENICAI